MEYTPWYLLLHTLYVRKPCIGAGQHLIYCTRYMLTSSSQQNRKTTKNPCTDTQYGHLSHCSEPRIPVHVLLRTEYSVRDYGPYHTLHHMEPPDDAFQILRSNSIVRCRNRLVCLCAVAPSPAFILVLHQPLRRSTTPTPCSARRVHACEKSRTWSGAWSRTTPHGPSHKGPLQLSETSHPAPSGPVLRIAD